MRTYAEAFLAAIAVTQAQKVRSYELQTALALGARPDSVWTGVRILR